MFVYWIHLKHHKIKTDGYVGITNNPSRRWKEHQNLNKVSSVVCSAINKYKNEIVYEIIFEGSQEACQHIEEYFRPLPEIGWNLVIGGGLPPRNTKPKSKETIAKTLATRKANGNLTMSEATKDLIRQKRLGKKASEESKQKQKQKWNERKSNPNFIHNQSKISDVYHRINGLVASDVILKHWCLKNNINFTGLSKTTKADRSKPASRANRLFHKDYYAIHK